MAPNGGHHVDGVICRGELAIDPHERWPDIAQMMRSHNPLLAQKLEAFKNQDTVNHTPTCPPFPRSSRISCVLIPALVT